jgi:hypothetical protein
LKNGKNKFNVLNFEGSESSEEVDCEIIDYDGTVHCITVPNGIFYIQRNGIPANA